MNPASPNPAVVLLPQHDSSSLAIASPRQRWEVVGAIVIVSFLTILARAGISGAKLEMAHDLVISDLGFGLVFGAFALGYAVFMVPCGLLADRWGPRKSLTLSVFFWSLFTLCTGLASGISVLIGIRFLFGLAEAGVYPQAARAIHNWTLARERGLALGLLNMGSRLGAAFGLLAAPVCVAWLGWRESFVFLGIIGAIWAAIWFWWFRDTPGIKLNRHNIEAFSSGDENTRVTNKTPWRAFLSSRNFYLITYQYFASQFTFFICLSWLLPFLKSRFGITTSGAGLYSSIPLYCGALAMWMGGTAICCDVGGRYSGTLSAAMNTMGALGSLASSLLFPVLIGWAGNIRVYFYLAALLNIIALGCWKYIEPAKSLLPEENWGWREK